MQHDWHRGMVPPCCHVYSLDFMLLVACCLQQMAKMEWYLEIMQTAGLKRYINVSMLFELTS